MDDPSVPMFLIFVCLTGVLVYARRIEKGRVRNIPFSELIELPNALSQAGYNTPKPKVAKGP